MTPARLGPALAAASAGGVLGSLARYGLTEWFGVSDGFPWSVFAINVVGSALLAALAGVAAVTARPVLAVFLGAGVLGGFTTMSAASAETVVLLEHSETATAVLYSGGTLLAALAAVRLVAHLLPGSSRTDPDVAA